MKEFTVDDAFDFIFYAHPKGSLYDIATEMIKAEEKGVIPRWRFSGFRDDAKHGYLNSLSIHSAELEADDYAVLGKKQAKYTLTDQGVLFVAHHVLLALREKPRRSRALLKYLKAPVPKIVRFRMAELRLMHDQLLDSARELKTIVLKNRELKLEDEIEISAHLLPHFISLTPKLKALTYVT
jgi:hypothetical protein